MEREGGDERRGRERWRGKEEGLKGGGRESNEGAGEEGWEGGKRD